MITAIKEIINPEVVLDMATGDKRLILKESAIDSKIKKLFVESIPDGSFAFTLDHQPSGQDNRMYKQLSCYVNIGNQKGVNKGCDLILFIPEGNNCTVLIFDLKSKKPNKEDTEKQLLNSELFIRYLITLIRCYYKIDTNSVSYKRAIVTTSGRNGIPKSSTYRPNERKREQKSFHIQPVRVNYRKEAHVYLGALLR